MSVNPTIQPPTDHSQLGAFLAERLREHFPAETERERQVLALAEEAGEFVGAFRRAAGMARRTGRRDDVAAELADVAITTHVTAHVLGIEVAPIPPETAPASDPPRCVLEVFAAAAWGVDAYLGDSYALPSALTDLAQAVRRAAQALQIDLDAAIHAKTTAILARGWRDRRDDEVAACRVCGCTEDQACEGGCQWVPDPTMTGDLCSRCAPEAAPR